MAHVPIGGILNWSSAAGSVPANYAICDGTIGTPDLRDRFVIGAGGAYAVSATGGANNYTLPGHTHDAISTTANNITHNHPLVVTTDSVTAGASADTTSSLGGTGVGDAGTAHDHAISVTSNTTSHHHTATGTYAAADLPGLDQRPPWWALYFIQRMS